MAPRGSGPVSLIGRQVETAQFHVGFGFAAKTGLNVKKDDAYMEIQPTGVYVKKKDGEWLVPYSNVVWTQLLGDL